MRLFTSPRVIAAFLGAGILLPISCLAKPQDAQSSQDSSVADAARRNREKKKNAANASKSTKVITDDDLPKRVLQPGQEGLNVGAAPKLETEPPSAQAVAAAEASDKASEKEATEQDGEIARLKEQVADAEKDVDLGQRQLALDQDSYLSNPDHANDEAGKAKLENERQQINDQQQTVERLKLRLAALEELKSQRKSTRKATAAPAAAETPKQTETAPATPPQL